MKMTEGIFLYSIRYILLYYQVASIFPCMVTFYEGQSYLECTLLQLNNVFVKEGGENGETNFQSNPVAIALHGISLSIHISRLLKSFWVKHSLSTFHVIGSFSLDFVYCHEQKAVNIYFLHFSTYLGLLYYK